MHDNQNTCKHENLHRVCTDCDLALDQSSHNMAIINREKFMEYFRSDDYGEELSTDDKIEIFINCLAGSSDITKELLNDVCDNYGGSLEQVMEDGKLE